MAITQEEQQEGFQQWEPSEEQQQQYSIHNIRSHEEVLLQRQQDRAQMEQSYNNRISQLQNEIGAIEQEYNNRRLAEQQTGQRYRDLEQQEAELLEREREHLRQQRKEKSFEEKVVEEYKKINIVTETMEELHVAKIRRRLDSI